MAIVFICTTFFCFAEPGTILYRDVENILLNGKLLKAIGMTGEFGTSELESFHSNINHYAPKMEGFSYHGQVSRLAFKLINLLLSMSVFQFHML